MNVPFLGEASNSSSSLSYEMPPYVSLNLLELPLEVMEKIFSYLNYETISKIRLVCKQFNEISSSLLNSAFQRLQTLMLQRFQKIKAQMPRRESARRKHPLARESDIIETLHMRLTLLQMSFGKHIERKHCCFFAGEILDEVYRILRYVKTTPSLARAYKVTDELFDLSTMAMEYFKERIEPTLPEITYFGSDFLDFNSFSNSPGSSASPTGSLNQSNSSDDASDPSQNSTTLKKKLKRFRQVMKRHGKRQTSMLRDLKRCRSRLTDQEKQMKEMSNRLEDCTKKAEESACKFNAVLQELNKCKTELQYWRSKSPANQTCSVCGKMFASNEETRSLPGETVDELPSQPSSSSSTYKVPELLFDKPSTSNFIPISDHTHRNLTVDYFQTETSIPTTSPFIDSSSPLSQTPPDESSSPSQSLPLKRKWSNSNNCSQQVAGKKTKLSDCNSSDGDSEVAILSACFDSFPVKEKI